ncbi:iron chaperone [Methanobacterium sp. ACI-7]|uniref:iron chaperone n=1 Tax=unclassified Methanobacterium TaxID=2627676 RepID=UPI0039C388BE
MKNKKVVKETEDNKKPETVDDYLASVSKKDREVLENLRNTIKSAAPQSEEVISYGIPTYKYKGPLVHFAAFKNYLSFYGINKSLLDTFKDELKDYKISGTTVHFTAEKPLSEEFVRKIVKKRIEENEEHAKK